MKLGILTYHRAINLGSIVQAYCLQKKIRMAFPGARVEIIDYRPGARDYRESTKHLSRFWPFFDRGRWSEIRSIRRFSRDVLDFSSGHVTTRHLPRARAWFEQQGYDAIFVGSDTVWEYRPRSYAPPEPNVFHLPWDVGSRKLSFAASADPVPPEAIANSEHRTEIARAINAFDVLGVRDDATLEFLSATGVDTTRAYKMLDPSLQVDFDEVVDEYEIRRPEGKPIAAVSVSQSVAPRIADVLRRKGFSVWSWGGKPREWSDGHLPPHLTASQVLGAYRNLSAFVTDRFHGSIFSLRIGGIVPIFIETQEKWPTPNSKVRDLFGTLNLGERVIRNDHSTWLDSLDALIETETEMPDLRSSGNLHYDAAVRRALTA